ncbi:hypothetical protein BC937DRAFT_93586 [Endogone sp. FLAS-F59071]|nr:hypothetical protein BC937DRAFT_93586 [Endogone sp. FLAS-F59071]|eukprot:RUS14592.1 hypothetical protein BC937DRAFT_93586 [Endogone sp. FLAS-F59071]
MSDQLPELLSRLMPFAQLTPKNKSIITEYKSMFLNDPDTLRSSLMKLDASELEDCLNWIPFSEFTRIKQIGKGAFASVYKASFARGPKKKKHQKEVVALKEDPKKPELSHLSIINSPQLVINTYLTYCVGLSRSTIRIIGPKNEQVPTGDGVCHWRAAYIKTFKPPGRASYVYNDLHPGNIVYYTPNKPEHDFYPQINVGLSQSRKESMKHAGVYGRLEYLPAEAWSTGWRTPLTFTRSVRCLLFWQLVVGIPPSLTASPEHCDLFGGLREEKIQDGLLGHYQTLLE